MQSSSTTEFNKQKLHTIEELKCIKEFIDEGKIDQIKELCQQNPEIVNAEIEVSTRGGSKILLPPLIYAISTETNHTLETVKMLINCGANLQQENRSCDRVDGITKEIYNEPRTPLAYAFDNPKSMSIVKLLIRSPGGKEALKSFEENASWTCNKSFTRLLEYQEQKEEILKLFSKKSLSNFMYMQLTELSTIVECHELLTQLHDNIFNNKSTFNQHCIKKLYNKNSYYNGFIALQKHVDDTKYTKYKTSLAIGLDHYLSTSDQTQISDNNAIILYSLFDRAKYVKVGETNWQSLYNKIYPTIKSGRQLTIVDIQDMLKMITSTYTTDAHFFVCLRYNLLNQYACDKPSLIVNPLMRKIPDLAKIITTNPKAIETLSEIFNVIKEDIAREDIASLSLHNSENSNDSMLECASEDKHSEQMNITNNIAEEQIEQNPDCSYTILLKLSGYNAYHSWV